VILGANGQPINSTKNALTEEERAKFDFIISSKSVGLMRVLFDDEPAAAICIFTEAPDGSYDVVPVAVLVNDSLFDRFTPPDGTEETQ